MNILLLSAGRRVTLMNIIKESIKRLKIDSKVFTVDAKMDNSPACMLNKSYSFEVPRVDDSNYLKEILKFVHENSIKLIVPTIDTELKILSNNRNAFLEQNVEILISDRDVIEICQDKSRQKELFNNFNIKTPELLHPKKLSFPLFAKPKTGSRSQGIFSAKSINEIPSASLENEELIFMELIDTKIYDEFTVDMYFSDQSDLIDLVPRHRIIVRDGEVSVGKTNKGRIYEILMKKFKSFAGARGCITAQFFFNPVNEFLYGIEINPRFGGGYPLSDYAGAKFCEYAIREYLLNEKIESQFNWKDNIKMLRHDSEFFFET